MNKISKFVLTICVLLIAFTPILASAATNEGCGIDPNVLASANGCNVNSEALASLNKGDLDRILKDCNVKLDDKNMNVNDVLAKIKDKLGADFQMPNMETAKPEAPAKETPAPPATPAEPQAPAKETPAPAASGSYEKQVIDLVNQERAKAGLSPLKENTELANVAEVKAEDMRDNNYFSHTSPVYGSPFDMMKQFGIKYSYAGENIAKGQRSPEQVMNGWMNSEGHRANILNSNFTEIGVGYVTDSNGGTYWVQMFIRP
ncbi:MAG: CAP domain-containing protein [Clostridia bacterium]|nr:CAP domain-containing protein [Clostridia bacterium]